jgi:hypothetical protein
MRDLWGLAGLYLFCFNSHWTPLFLILRPHLPTYFLLLSKAFYTVALCSEYPPPFLATPSFFFVLSDYTSLGRPPISHVCWTLLCVPILACHTVLEFNCLSPQLDCWDNWDWASISLYSATWMVANRKDVCYKVLRTIKDR